MEYWKNKELNNLTEISDGSLRVEEWRSISGFDGLYEVSNFGRIKSLSRKIERGNNSIITTKDKILSIQKCSNGYLMITLWKNNISYQMLLHRIVGLAFLNNENNLPEINHKKGNKMDNRSWMIEWITKSDNKKHSFRVLGNKHSKPMLGKTGSKHHNSKKVYCPTLQVYFESARIASRELGISQGTISDICRGAQLQRDGLTFKYI